MAVRQVNADSAVAPNLVPMVDIMFLLLLFLMVGADMGNRELEEVHLPIARSAVEDPHTEQPDELLTLNVYHSAAGCTGFETLKLCADRKHWTIGVRGTDYNDERILTTFLKQLAKEDCEKRGKELPDLRIRIRADEAAQFEHVQTAMACCAEARIYKVELGAATMSIAEAQ